MNIIQEIKKIFNNPGASSEVISTKKKYPEIHVQLGSLELCREFAEKKAKNYPSDKVKLNDYTYRNGIVRGVKVIPFIDKDIYENPSECTIYKLIGKPSN